MTFEDWQLLTKEQKAAEIKALLQEIIILDKNKLTALKTGTYKPTDAKFKLEQQVLEKLKWEREENE